MSQNLSREVLGQCEVSQHLSECSSDSTECPNIRTKGPGTLRGAPTLEWEVLEQYEVSQNLSREVLGQCEVSQRLSEGSWDSTKCLNT